MDLLLRLALALGLNFSAPFPLFIKPLLFFPAEVKPLQTLPLCFSEEIQPSLRTLFTELNKVGIPFSITSVRDPNQLYRESLLEKRDTIGLLKLGDKQLGYGLSEGETPSRLKSPCFIHAKTQNCIYQLTFSAAFEKTLVGGEIISHDSEDRPETWVHLINVVETVDCRADYHAEYPERYLRFSSVSRV